MNKVKTEITYHITQYELFELLKKKYSEFNEGKIMHIETNAEGKCSYYNVGDLFVVVEQGEGK